MRVTIDSLGTCLRRPDGRVDLALCSDSHVSWHGRYLNPPGYTQAKDLLHFELDADSGTLTVQCMRKDNFTSPEPVMVFDDLPTGKPLYVAHTHTHTHIVRIRVGLTQAPMQMGLQLLVRAGVWPPGAASSAHHRRFE